MAINSHNEVDRNPQIDWKGADFHTLDSTTVESILEEAKRQKYYKPKNANGSRARYFFYAVQRQLNWK